MTPLMALLRQPMLHFLAGGALLFLAYGLLGGKDGTGERSTGRLQGQERRIVVTRGQVESLTSGFATRWRRPPVRRNSPNSLPSMSARRRWCGRRSHSAWTKVTG